MQDRTQFDEMPIFLQELKSAIEIESLFSPVASTANRIRQRFGQQSSLVARLQPSRSNAKANRLSFWQLWNMSFGFLGIQFGWGLQMANTSAIFEHLGAEAHQIPILWIAAPITGLIVQPIIGNLSDCTWGFLGRRRPYFLVGAIFSSIALMAMPHASSLWMAAGMLWILDTAANISMEPFRAFVGDLLPAEQQTQGFALQSLLIGVGSVLASALPWILNHGFGIASRGGSSHAIPQTIEFSFYLGAAVFLGTVLWTVLTTREHPPQNWQAFREKQRQQGGLLGSFREIGLALRHMPPTMRQLAQVQCLTWVGLYCFFLYFPPAVARNIFGAIDRSSELYADGIEWAGICIAVYNAVCALFALILPYFVRRTSPQLVHSLCLLAGGVGLISLVAIDDPLLLFPAMVGVGVAWSSILALPYSILSQCLPEDRRGIYQGIFNFFIVLPQIAVSLVFGWIVRYWLHDDRLLAIVVGGFFLILAAIWTHRIEIQPPRRQQV